VQHKQKSGKQYLATLRAGSNPSRESPISGRLRAACCRIPGGQPSPVEIVGAVAIRPTLGSAWHAASLASVRRSVGVQARWRYRKKR
jgi:hypothetical protein